jgi:hypothetical protein
MLAAAPLIRPITPSTSSVSMRRGTACSRQSTISHWWYIWRSRRSASGCVAAMIEMLSTCWPDFVRIWNPNRIMPSSPALGPVPPFPGAPTARREKPGDRNRTQGSFRLWTTTR